MAAGLCTTRRAMAFILVACLVWMDACLYFKIQSFNDQDKNYDNYDDDLYEQQTFNSSSNIMGRMEPLANKFSFAFEGMSIKLMMTDPMDNYIMGPLSELFARVCNFKHNFLYISANMVSYAGVLAAMFAGWLVSHNSRSLHKMSFVLFQLRTWLDDLDGVVARLRRGIHKHVSLSKTPGYVIDGLCDAIGFAVYIIGCYIYLRNNVKRLQASQAVSYGGRSHKTERYNLQSVTRVKPSASSSNDLSCYVPLSQHEEARNWDKSDCESLFEVEQEEEEEQEEETEVEILCRDPLMRDTEPIYNKQEEDGRRNSTNKARKGTKRAHLLMEHMRINLPKERPSNMILYRYIKEKIRRNLSYRKLVTLILCFSLQLALCSFFWNRYILVYRDLLETPSSNVLQARAKRKILKSNILYFLIWFWRLVNGHSFMQLFAGSILLGKVLQFLQLIKCAGFVVIIALALITELHTLDVRNHLIDLAN